MLCSRQDVALELLTFRMQQRLAEGYSTLLLDDVNAILYVAKKTVIDPDTKKELEVK